MTWPCLEDPYRRAHEALGITTWKYPEMGANPATQIAAGVRCPGLEISSTGSRFPRTVRTPADWPTHFTKVYPGTCTHEGHLIGLSCWKAVNFPPAPVN